MLLAYRKQINQNQHKTVRRTVTSYYQYMRMQDLSNFFRWPPFTDVEVANSSKSKVVILRYCKNSDATPITTGKLACYSSSLIATAHLCPQEALH